MAEDTKRARSSGREREIMPFAEEPSLDDVARIAARAVTKGDEEIRRFCVLSLATGLDAGIATLVGPDHLHEGRRLVVPRHGVPRGFDGRRAMRGGREERVLMLPPSAVSEFATWSGDPWIGIGTAQLRHRLHHLQTGERPGLRLLPSRFREVTVYELRRRSPDLGAARIRAWLGLRHDRFVSPKFRFDRIDTSAVVEAAEHMLREAHERSGGVLLRGGAIVGDEDKVG